PIRRLSCSTLFPYTTLFRSFDSLRLSEAIDILNELNIDIPDLPNTLMRNAIRGIFTKLNPIDVQSCMIKTLKRTRNLAPLSTLIDRKSTRLNSSHVKISYAV